MCIRDRDQVPVGVNEPTLNGYAGLNIRYKSWEIGTHLNYSFGADKYNYTLHQKIENVNYMTNNDRRALTERWQKPGDVALYKAITDNSATKATSRFVQHEIHLSIECYRTCEWIAEAALLPYGAGIEEVISRNGESKHGYPAATESVLSLIHI